MGFSYSLSSPLKLGMGLHLKKTLNLCVTGWYFGNVALEKKSKIWQNQKADRWWTTYVISKANQAFGWVRWKIKYWQTCTGILQQSLSTGKYAWQCQFWCTKQDNYMYSISAT